MAGVSATAAGGVVSVAVVFPEGMVAVSDSGEGGTGMGLGGVGRGASCPPRGTVCQLARCGNFFGCNDSLLASRRTNGGKASAAIRKGVRRPSTRSELDKRSFIV